MKKRKKNFGICRPLWGQPIPPFLKKAILYDIFSLDIRLSIFFFRTTIRNKDDVPSSKYFRKLVRKKIFRQFSEKPSAELRTKVTGEI